MKLTPVDFDPFAGQQAGGQPTLTPVDFDPFAPQDQGGFTAGLKASALSGLQSAARPYEDITGRDAGVSNYVEQNMPGLAFTSPGAILDRPAAVVPELLAQQAVPLGAVVGGAAIGRKVGGALSGIPALRAIPREALEMGGERVGAFIPSMALQYDEARQRQEEEGTDNIPRALLSAAGGASIEQFGLEGAARKLLFGRGKSIASRAKEAGKGAVIGAGIEAPTEIAQSSMSMLAAGQNPLERPDELAMSAIGGAVGGGVAGGALGALQRKGSQEELTPKPDAQGPGAQDFVDDTNPIGDDVDPTQLFAETVDPQPEEAPQAQPEAPTQRVEPEAEPIQAELVIPEEIVMETPDFEIATDASGVMARSVDAEDIVLQTTPEQYMDMVLSAAPPRMTALPAPGRTASGAIESPGEISGNLIFGREVGRPFKSAMDARSYRREIDGLSSMDVVKQGDQWALRPRAPLPEVDPEQQAQAERLKQAYDRMVLIMGPKVAARRARTIDQRLAKQREIPANPADRSLQDQTQLRADLATEIDNATLGVPNEPTQGAADERAPEATPDRAPKRRRKKELAGPLERAQNLAEAERRRLLRILKDSGGIEIREREDVTRETGRTAVRVAPGLFTKAGRPLDAAVQVMIENGFMNEADRGDTVDGAVQLARDIIHQAISKMPLVSPFISEEYNELMNEVAMDARDAAAEMGIDDDDFIDISSNGLDTESKQDVLDADLLARIESHNPEDFEDATIRFEDDADLMAWAIEYARNIDEQGTSAEVNSGSEGDVEAPFDLTSQTESTRQSDEQRVATAQEAERAQRQQAEARAQSERDAGDFVLTGSDRPADVGTARGQTDIFATRTDEGSKPQVDVSAAETAAEKPKESRTATADDGSRTIESARARLIKDLGAGIESLETQGILQIVTSKTLPEDLKAQIGPKTDALYDGATATGYILADRASPERLKALVLHEIGEHYALPGMLGTPRYTALLDDVRKMVSTSKDAKFKEAVEHVRANYNLDEVSNDFAREVIARYAENPGSDSIWKRLTGMIREFTNSIGLTNISESDLQHLVQKALRKAMRGEVSVMSPEGDFKKVSASKQKDITENENFRKWFGASKVVDADGKPLVVYHGTDSAISTFDEGKSKNGFWFSDNPSDAADYGDSTVEAYLSLKNPAYFERTSGDRGVNEAIEKAKADGYDGLIVTAPEDGDANGMYWPTNYVAFRPEQIKSVFNRGTFDPASSLILESRGAGASTVLPEMKWWQNFQSRIQDRFNRWQVAKDYIEKINGGPLDFTQDVVSVEKVRFGKQQDNANIFKDRFTDPIEKILKTGKHSLDRFDEYNMAKHAPERNKAIAKINPDMPDGGSGMTDAESADFMKTLTPKERIDFEKANKLLVGANRWRLKLQLDNGLISQDEFDVLTEKYEHYVPLKSVDEPEQAIDGLGAVGYTIRGREFKQALGRRSKSASPYLVTIIDGMRAINRAGLATVSKAAWELSANPNAQSLMRRLDPKDLPTEFQVQKIYKVPVKDDQGRIIREPVMQDGKPVLDANGKPKMQNKTKEEVKYGVDANYAQSVGVLGLRVDGKTEYVQVFDKQLYTQFKNMDEAQLTGVMLRMNQATGLLGRMFTQFNPAFVPINFLRDLLTVTVNSLGIPGMNAGKVFSGTFASIPAIYSHQFGDRSHPLSKEYAEFLSEGATTGGLGLLTFEQQQRAAKRRGLTVKAGEKALASRAVGMGEDFINFVADSNEIVENATRFSVYRNAKEAFIKENKKAGMSDAKALGDAKQRAAVLAREVSVDFNKRGEYTRAIASFYVFFNAAVQGLRSFYNFNINSPNARKVQGALFGLVFAGFAARVFNHIANGFDDELAEEEALSFDATASLAIPVQVGENLIKFPLPYIYNVPAMLGYRMADWAITGRVGHNVGRLTSTLIGSLSPLGEPTQASSPVGFLTKTFSPSLLRPIADIQDNTSGFGAPLAKKPSLWDKAPPPRAYDHWRGASDTGVAIAKLLNFISGGDEEQPGAIDISPEHLDYLASYYGAGPARFIKQTFKLGDSLISDSPLDKVPPSQYPIVGRLYAEAQPEYYVPGQYREIEKEMGYVEAKIKNNKPVDSADRRVLSILQSTDRQLRKEYARLREAKDRGDEVRQAQIEERINDMKARVVRTYNMKTGRYEEAMQRSSKADAAQAAQTGGKPAFAALIMDMR